MKSFIQRRVKVRFASALRFVLVFFLLSEDREME